MATIESVLKSVAPNADKAFLAATAKLDMIAIMGRFGISDPKSQAQLIGHMAVESGGYRLFSENLSYSAERLCQVWPSRFPSIAVAQPYAHNPQRLAEKVYNGRMGNREGSSDGWDYRGSGTLQHTGRAEFQRVQTRTGEPVLAFPEQLRDKAKAKTMWLGACSYFVDRGALTPAKAGDTQGVTLKINGGLNGLADRRIYVDRAIKAIGSSPIQSGPAAVSDTGQEAKRADDGPMPTTEVAAEEKKKRDTATVVGTGVPPAASAGTKFAADWVVAGCVGIIVAILAFLAVRSLWRRHAEAVANVERLQLAAIQQKLVGG